MKSTRDVNEFQTVTPKQVVAWFEAEREALAMRDQPNIAKVIECGVANPAEIRPGGAPVQAIASRQDRRFRGWRFWAYQG